MGIQLGNGFLDTRCRPVNTDLDFTGLPFAFRPSFLGVSLITGPGLTADASGLLPVEFLVLCVAAIHGLFYGVSFQDGAPIYLLLGGPGYSVPAGQRLMSSGWSS